MEQGFFRFRLINHAVDTHYRTRKISSWVRTGKFPFFTFCSRFPGSILSVSELCREGVQMYLSARSEQNRTIRALATVSNGSAPQLRGEIFGNCSGTFWKTFPVIRTAGHRRWYFRLGLCTGNVVKRGRLWAWLAHPRPPQPWAARFCSRPAHKCPCAGPLGQKLHEGNKPCIKSNRSRLVTPGPCIWTKLPVRVQSSPPDRTGPDY